MKILIIANCQGEALALAIRTMNPRLYVDYIMSTSFDFSETDLNLYEHILIQKNSIDINLFGSVNEKIQIFPSIAFSGYHPDMTYARGINKVTGKLETIYTPMYSYHSALVLYSYLNNLNQTETFNLFNGKIYSKLGYYEEFASSLAMLENEIDEVGLWMPSKVQKWLKSGNFMHTFNHPHIRVMCDLATILMDKIQLPILIKNVTAYIKDPLAEMPIWPVYPEIAERHGIDGEYIFKKNSNNELCYLEDFITASFQSYEKYEFSSIEPLNFSVSEFRHKIEKNDEIYNNNPYKLLPDYNFWKKSLINLPIENIDPVVISKFKIYKDAKVSTAGSCFAQHISRTLVQNGFNYYITEKNLLTFDDNINKIRNYGVYSARFGNIYTARQLWQLIQRSYKLFEPQEKYWIRDDGKLVDPFRPQIEPDGYKSENELLLSRDEHFAAVRVMIETMDVFIFTLGLTESWCSKLDGACYPLAPGVVAGAFNESLYEFKNFDVDSVVADLNNSINFIKKLNRKCKFILTVSPVPLLATYENRHVLISTTYSKSVLRVAAELVAHMHTDVAYFPSFEIITGTFNRGQYYDIDQRTVLPIGVDHVMKLFNKHYMTIDDTKELPNNNSLDKNTIKHSIFEIVCDEEAIENFRQ